MLYVRKFALILVIVVIAGKLNAQLTAVSGGLAFSSGVDYNSGTTGNPGLYGRAYLKVNKRFHIVPSLIVFNKYKKSTFSEVLKTNMYHADLDGMFGLYKDRSLRFLGFAGINATAIVSKWDILIEKPGSENYKNISDVKPGVNLGGAFHLYVNDTFDAYVSAKYVFSSFDQAVINVGAIYYLAGKRRRGSW